MSEYVECTTESTRKRHLTEADWRRSTLCGQRAYSQWQIDQFRVSKPVIIAELPLCKQCEKSRQRRIDGRRS